VEERKEKGGKEKRRRRGKDPDCIEIDNLLMYGSRATI
jgi:hypothetical protein